VKKIRDIAIDSAKRMANLAGVEVTQYWKLHELALVQHLRRVLDHYRIETIIDVGANLGQFHDLLRDDVGFAGQIYSFEPVSKCADLLIKRARQDPKWKIFKCALGSTAGHAKINVAQASDLSSFLAPKTDAVSGFWKANPISHEETVEIRTLDAVLQAEGIDCTKERTYLKLDTQGFDLEVMKGGEQSLMQIAALQTEASVQPIYENMPNYLEAIESVNGYGFELCSMFPVNYDQALRAIEFDCMFINKKFSSPTNVQI
jgi:FkbM family methyltransferase